MEKLKEQKNQNILFSIIIPVYNAQKHLSKCVDSVLSQRIQNYELLLIDDGSTDNSSEMCDWYTINDNRVKVVHKKNGGANSARNVGIENAIGQYICLIDSDDYITDNYLSVIYNAINRSAEFPDIILINYDYEGLNINSGNEIGLPAGYYCEKKLNELIFPYAISKGNRKSYSRMISPAPWSMVYKAELIKTHYCTDLSIKVNNDVAFTYECLYCSSGICICDERIYVHNYTTNNSLQRAYHPRILQNDAVLFNYLDNNLKILHPTIPEQLDDLKADIFRRDIQKYYSLSPSFLVARRDLKRGIEESCILDMVDIQGMPLMSRIRVLLLRHRFYLLCLLLQKLIDKIKRNVPG